MKFRTFSRDGHTQPRAVMAHYWDSVVHDGPAMDIQLNTNTLCCALISSSCMYCFTISIVKRVKELSSKLSLRAAGISTAEITLT